MTKEEREKAIKNIKEHCYFANLLPQAKEALDMAIEALSEESKLDKIVAEIEENYHITSYKDCLDIINKYREVKE